MGTRSIKAAQLSVLLETTIQNELDIAEVGEDDGPISSGLVSLSRDLIIESGIDSNQADRAWQWRGTIEQGRSKVFWLASLTGFDVGGGDGKDMLGQAWDAVDIVAIMITNNNEIGTYGFVEITPGFTKPLYSLGSHLVANGGAIGAQGVFFRIEPDLGLAVEAGVSESIRVFANGGDCDVSVILLGRSNENESSSSSSSTSSVTSSSSASSLTSSSSKSSLTSSSSSSSSSVTSSSSLSSSSSSISTSSSSS